MASLSTFYLSGCCLPQPVLHNYRWLLLRALFVRLHLPFLSKLSILKWQLDCVDCVEFRKTWPLATISLCAAADNVTSVSAAPKVLPPGFCNCTICWRKSCCSRHFAWRRARQLNNWYLQYWSRSWTPEMSCLLLPEGILCFSPPWKKQAFSPSESQLEKEILVHWLTEEQDCFLIAPEIITFSVTDIVMHEM